MAKGRKSRTSQGQSLSRVSSLRSEYKGYCPLVQCDSASGGQGFQLTEASVERRPFADITPEVFFADFVRPRRPVVLTGEPGKQLGLLFGLQGKAARWAAETAAMRESSAGACKVVVERRGGRSESFGTCDDADRQRMTLAQVCHDIEGGSELLYLSTQPLPEDDDGCPSVLAAPHVLKLLQKAKRLRPKLLGNLAPAQYNIWFGHTTDGATSGLHHDFHDNMYVLLRGAKEFRLFSPRCVDLLEPAGAAKKSPQLHANGLICYGPGIRDDGAPIALTQSKMAGNAADTDSDDEEAMLESALEGKFGSSSSRKKQQKQADQSSTSAGLPDSFCRLSTAAGSGSSGMPGLPPPLRGLHLTASLTAGDLLYLPASWFHEVISRGGSESDGHLALNLWMAPPHTLGTFTQPYEDDFWQKKYVARFAAARAAHPRQKKRPIHEQGGDRNLVSSQETSTKGPKRKLPQKPCRAKRKRSE